MAFLTVHIQLAGGVKLEVRDFNTEGGYDNVMVNGKSYSGRGAGLNGIKATGIIQWSSHDSVDDTGFKICAMCAAT